MLILDLDELNKYLSFTVNMEENKNGIIINHRAHMKYCTEEDFDSAGLHVDADHEERL